MKKSRIILALLLSLSLMVTAFMLDSCGGDTTTDETTADTTAAEETTAAETEAPKVTGFEITTPPTKLEYSIGDELDLTGMVCTVTYSDGTTAECTEYKVSVDGPITPSDKTVLIRYNTRYKDSFDITILPGDNLCLTATILEASPGNKEKNIPERVIDGDIGLTKWCSEAKSDNVPDDLKGLAAFYMIIDLGDTYTFDRYCLYSSSQSTYASDQGATHQDTVAWSMEVSSDLTTWEKFSDVENNTDPVYTGTFEPVTGRYVRLLVTKAETNSANTLRIYEIEIFKVKAETEPAA